MKDYNLVQAQAIVKLNSVSDPPIAKKPTIISTKVSPEKRKTVTKVTTKDKLSSQQKELTRELKVVQMIRKL